MLPITDRWLEPSPSFAISVADRPAKDGNVVVNLEEFRAVRICGVNPRRSKDVALKSAEYEISSNKTTILLKDRQPAGAQRVPFTVEITENGLTDSLRSDSATVQSTPDSSMFTMPVGAPTDTTYDASIPAAIETRRAEIGLHPRAPPGGRGRRRLVHFGQRRRVHDDDTETADAMHSPGARKGVGARRAALQEPFRTAKMFSLGPASFKDPLFLELDLHQLSGIFKVKLAGIVGYDFFRRFTVGVNLSKPQVSVFDSAKYTLPSGAWSPMKFSTGNPGVEATFEGDHKAWFRIDTGANGTVTFHSPTVDRLGMLKGRDNKPAGMAGVGGTTEAEVGKLAWFELGGHRFEKVEATFSLLKTGAFAGPIFRRKHRPRLLGAVRCDLRLRRFCVWRSCRTSRSSA